MLHVEALPYLLKELKLPAIKTHWAERAKLAEMHHWSYGEFLADLLDMELSGREQRRLQETIRQSKLPSTKTLANFDFQRIQQLMQLKLSSSLKTNNGYHRQRI